MHLSKEQTGELQKHYQKHKNAIAQRLHEFKQVKEEEHFRELCFCLLAANTSSRMALRVMNEIGDVINKGDEEAIKKRLHELHCRFYNKRAEFIHKARNRPLKLDRKYLVKNFKGIGYKEASHFLRNVGQSGYAILDKHVLRGLVEFGIIKKIPTLNKKRYLAIEKKVKKFSEELGIGMDELDFVLWSRKSGEILK